MLYSVLEVWGLPVRPPVRPHIRRPTARLPMVSSDIRLVQFVKSRCASTCRGIGRMAITSTQSKLKCLGHTFRDVCIVRRYQQLGVHVASLIAMENAPALHSVERAS